MTEHNPVEIWESLHELTHVLKNQMLIKLHQSHPELSFIEMRIITMVGENPGITQKELIEKSHIDKAQMARLLANMETLQWLQRRADEVDRRIRRLELSNQGVELYKQLQIWRAELAQDAFELWPNQLREAVQSSVNILKNK